MIKAAPTLPTSPSSFTRYGWLTAGLFVILAGAFAAYSRSELQIARAYDRRYQSFLLADELRQSSDDLTRMARTYVVTGDPSFKDHYRTILDIRDGRRPRPVGYQGIDWDLAENWPPSRPADGPAVALLELLRQAGFTAAEFGTLAQAKANSDALTAIEFKAMRLVETAGPGGERNRALARRMLHDVQYHQAKSAIMRPIAEFNRLMDRRTAAAVQAAKANALLMGLGFVALGLGLMAMVWRMSAALHATLGGSLDEVDRQQLAIARAQADLQRFAEVTAHHLQEPARRIASYAERLSAQLAGRLEDPEAQRSLQFIDQQARRMKALLGDVERYLAADQPRGPVASVDTGLVVTRMVKALAGRLASRGATVALGDLPRAWIDTPRLVDLFQVALDNALLYAVGREEPPLPKPPPPGGRREQDTHTDPPGGSAPAALHIRIDGERRGALVRYRISDNGPGIAAEYRERVFRVFERLATGGDGTGIGLAIVRRIAESNGGRAWIEETPDGGCRVLFELMAEKTP